MSFRPSERSESAGEGTRGRLLRAPLAGGAPALLTETSAKGQLGFEVSSNGLVASGCNVYFIDRCSEVPGGEFRIVAIAGTQRAAYQSSNRDTRGGSKGISSDAGER